MKVKKTITTKVSIEMNKQDIIEGINKHLKMGKFPDNANVSFIVPSGGNYSNMDIEIDYTELLQITYNEQIILLNKENIFQLLYGDKKLPESFKAFIVVPGGADWSGAELEIGDDTSLFIEYTEKSSSDKDFNSYGWNNFNKK